MIKYMLKYFFVPIALYGLWFLNMRGRFLELLRSALCQAGLDVAAAPASYI